MRLLLLLEEMRGGGYGEQAGESPSPGSHPISVRTQQEAGLGKTGREVLTRTQPCWHCDLKLPVSVTVRKQFLFLMSPSLWYFLTVQFSSVAQSCPILCDPIDCSTPGLHVHHQLKSIESLMPSNHLILCCPLLLPPSIFPRIRLFSNESVLRIRCGASASVLPVNIQDWFPLGWTGLISLLSKGHSRIFSSTTV